ncbi:Peptidoglycan-binding LysM [Chthoniobacter flavus Ellin428]|uniref:Peptidoglycan-binding LysM n=1 Tax=Chthoniobacter flavus Ellin428 TaxID=497964 RepID=B4D1Z7_9BACT|nr:LysM peptidoglycan-binding domain-containing protein [Chthoniobacter flavus]EDY19759.1 Peptidoglycan-binding LysM [Chthoniobacter flavus Ellin428]TCO92993.1 LysM domain-containing protein [Chthoniobacter flavus]
MKTPKFFSKLSAVLSPRPKKKLQATAARAARRPVDDYDDEEPTTNLSSAFVVVLILHVVAIGGIYAFNSIKASRRGHEPMIAPTEQTSATSQTASVQSEDNSTTDPAPKSQTASISHPVAETAPMPAVAPIKPATGHTYQVKAGDNFAKVALAYGVTPAQIMEANHLKEGSVLHQGQTLIIPAKTEKTADNRKEESTPKQADVPSTTNTPGFYTVKKGDTPTSIAHKHGLTVEELLKANKITDPKKLQVGQTLKVPPRKG